MVDVHVDVLYLHMSSQPVSRGVLDSVSAGIPKSIKNRSVGSMLAHVIDMLAPCCLRLAHIGLMLGHVGLKTAQDRSMLAPSWPQRPKWPPEASKIPQKCLGKAST